MNCKLILFHFLLTCSSSQLFTLHDVDYKIYQQNETKGVCNFISMAGQQWKPELGATQNSTFTIKQQQTINSGAAVNYYFYTSQYTNPDNEWHIQWAGLPTYLHRMIS